VASGEVFTRPLPPTAKPSNRRRNSEKDGFDYASLTFCQPDFTPVIFAFVATVAAGGIQQSHEPREVAGASAGEFAAFPVAADSDR
jgi:hypothetical protein